MEWNLIYVIRAVGIIVALPWLFSIPGSESSRNSGIWLLIVFPWVSIGIMSGAGMAGAENVIFGVAAATFIGAFILGYISVANHWASPLQSAFILVRIWLLLAVGLLIDQLAGEAMEYVGSIMFAHIWWVATAVLYLVCLAGGYTARWKFN